MPLFNVSIEGRRGCGYRKVGGLYLISKGLSLPCGRLPLKVTVCPCCSQGIKPARAWSWIDPDLLTKDLPPCEKAPCASCPMSGHLGEKVGLLWIGERFYETPAEFMLEASKMGVSRRIPRIPRSFEPGKTWVLLGHRRGFLREDGKYDPAIFFAFQPSHIEKVVTGNEPEAELQKLIDRGIQPVVVQPLEEQVSLEPGLSPVATA